MNAKNEEKTMKIDKNTHYLQIKHTQTLAIKFVNLRVCIDNNDKNIQQFNFSRRYVIPEFIYLRRLLHRQKLPPFFFLSCVNKLNENIRNYTNVLTLLRITGNIRMNKKSQFFI